MPSEHWPAMQAIEALRHSAEILERKAGAMTDPYAGLLTEVATQLRDIADRQSTPSPADDPRPALLRRTVG